MPSPTRASTLAEGLPGTWRSRGQGSAEVIYEIRPDGTFTRAQVLVQQRSSGVFSFTIGIVGVIEASDAQLIVRPRRGEQSMEDPDSPSSSYRNRPVRDLKPEVYEWSLLDDRLSLTGPYGTVDYERIGKGG